MNNKYEVGYSSITKKYSDKQRVDGKHQKISSSTVMLSGIQLVHLFEVYESWNSQYRSKKCRESRKSIKESIFQMLYDLDRTLILQRSNYQSLIEDGISKDEIEYDENQILEDIENVWNQRDRKSFEDKR